MIIAVPKRRSSVAVGAGSGCFVRRLLSFVFFHLFTTHTSLYSILLPSPDRPACNDDNNDNDDDDDDGGTTLTTLTQAQVPPNANVSPFPP